MAPGYVRTEPDDLEGWDPVPEGRYLAAITASEVRESRANPQSRYLWTQWEIQDGPHSGRRIWKMYHLWNQNDRAVAIAQKEMNEVLDALGLQEFEEAAELHDRTMQIRLRVRPPQNGYGASNEIASVSPARVGAGKAPSRPRRKPPKPEPDGERTELPDDDIPF